MTRAVVPHWAGMKRQKHQRLDWTPANRAKLEQLWNAGAPIEEICQEFEANSGSIYYKAHQMGLPRRIGRGTHLRKKKRKLPPSDRGQRRFVGVANSDGPKIILEPHHPAARKGTTFFPTTVVPASKMKRLLKSGMNSRKIGRILTKGRWKGMEIYTLTLEERDTCPSNCKEWLTCYGNNMHWAQRIHDDGTLTKRLWGELASLSAEHEGGFIVRLHVLGDFKSVEYVEFWRQALQDFPQLRIFGFTARIPPDPIGNAIAKLTADEYERFRMRFSAGGYETDCSEVVDKPEDVKFVRCPAETDEKRSCSTCGLCMQSNVSISFVRH